MIEYDAIAIAKLTPASGWGKLPDPATVNLNFTKSELEARIRRAHRHLVEGGLPPKLCVPIIGTDRVRSETDQEWIERLRTMNYVGARIPGDTNQQWADRLAAHPLFHTIRVAYLNLEALS